MQTHLSSIITDEQVRRYQADGAIMVPGLFEPRWLEALAAGIAETTERPSKRSTLYMDEAAAGGRFFYDARILGEVGGFDNVMLRSPMGEIAGRMMGSSTAILFYISIFERSPGVVRRTPWHQDQPSWSATGDHACSVWMPLDPAPRETALEMVRGSHRWGEFERPEFFTNPYEGDVKGELPPFPDIEANRGAYDILGWDMSPGDCLVFHGLTIHGGSGNLPPGLGRRAISVQWIGDDARYRVHRGGADPDISDELEAHGLRHGDPLVCAMCPIVWSGAASAVAPVEEEEPA